MSVYPFHGFRFADPKSAKIPGLTFVGWWSCHHAYGQRVTTDSGSGEARAASMAAVQSAGIAPLAQSDDAKRMRFYDVTIDGVTVLHGEATRNSELISTNATLLGAVSGDDPSFTICGVWGGTGVFACPISWTGAAFYEYPMHINAAGTGLRSWRYVGSTSGPTITNSASLVATPVTWCLFRNADRTQDTYIGGQYISTVTHTDFASATAVQCSTGDATSATGDNTLAEWAIWSGVPDGAGHTVRYRAVQRIVRSMGSRFGGLAG